MLLSSSTTSPLESLRPHLTESASVGLNSSVAYGLADTVSLYSSLKAHASSMFSTAGNPVPYSSNSWWTDEAMEALNYQFSSEELKILQDIASYRAQKGLPMPSVSKSLTAVAKIHAEDLFRNQPDHVGSCNLHSWSNKGFWTPVCYIVNPDGSHPYANLMWSKPKEITQKLFAQTFTGNGYEIAHSGDPANAVTSWKTSKGHNDVILEQDIWSNVDWNSIGVGVSNGHAVVWFAQESDPDDPGSNLNTAHKLGTLSGSRTFKESVGSSDPTDVYSFQVSKLSQVEVSIGGETISPSNTFSHGLVQLFRDTNSNGVLDAGEEAPLNLSAPPGGGSGWGGLGHWYWGGGPITYDLQPNVTYFAKVYPNITTSNSNLFYNLSLDVKAVEPGNTLSQAFNLGNVPKNTKVSDAVSSSDRNDLYQFNVSQPSHLNIGMSGAGDYGIQAADVRLIRDANRNGIVDSGEVVGLVPPLPGGVGWGNPAWGWSWSAGDYNYNLQPGEYYVDVSYSGSGSTSYELNMLFS